MVSSHRYDNVSSIWVFQLWTNLWNSLNYFFSHLSRKILLFDKYSGVNHTRIRQFVKFVWTYEIWTYLWLSLNYAVYYFHKISDHLPNLMVQTSLPDDNLSNFYEFLKFERTYETLWTISFLLPWKILLFDKSYDAKRPPIWQ